MDRSLHYLSYPLQVQYLDDATVVTFPDRSLVHEPTVAAIGQELLSLAQASNVRQLIINFGNVESCTSRTLSHLIACHRKLHAKGGKLILCNPSPFVSEILQTTNLDRVFEVRTELPDGAPETGQGLNGVGSKQPSHTPRDPKQSLAPHPSPLAPDCVEVVVGLCDFNLERARHLLTKLFGEVPVMHFTSLDALTHYCQSHVLPVIALPLVWPTASVVQAARLPDVVPLARLRSSPQKPGQHDSVLRFIRAFAGHSAIFTYAETDHLSIEVYSRPLAAGARQVINEGSPRFLDDFHDTVEHLALDHQARVQEEESLGSCMALHGLIGASARLREVFRRIVKASQFSDLPVLISGETGTGKQLVAEAIHRLDPRRRDKRFFTINCSTLSRTLAESELFGHAKGAFSGAESQRLGWFRAADGGVLFLDEIGELHLDLQPKLLRVLQDRRLLPLGADYEHEVDVRVIVATHRSLEKMVAAGTFRRDLYQRLHVFQIDIPPLRERPEDIELQAQYFLRRCQPGPEPRIVGFGPRILEALKLLPWEGNTRQLENLIRQAVAHKSSGTQLHMEDLPHRILLGLAELSQSASHTVDSPAALPALGYLDDLVRRVYSGQLTLAAAIDDVERHLVQKILEKAGGNRTRTAGILGVTPRSIFNKIKKHRLDEPR